MTDLRELTHTHFEPVLSEPFQVSGDPNEAFELELVEVTALRESAEGLATRRPFSLIFRGPGDLLLPQQTYRFENEKLGALEFMIVPIGPEEDGMRYQAIFN